MSPFNNNNTASATSGPAPAASKPKPEIVTTTDEANETVEGLWNGFQIRAATPDDYPAVIKHLRATYYIEEPCHKLLGWCEKKAEDLDLVVSHLLQHGLSLIAIHEESNQVAGVRLMYDKRRGLDFASLPFQSHHILTIMKSKNRLVEMEEERRRNNDPHYDHGRELEEQAKIPSATGFLVSTDPAFRGCGLARELYARSIAQCRRAGIKLAINFFSNPISANIVKKLGYEELCHLYLAELREKDGQLVFPTAARPPAHRIVYMQMKL